MKRIYSHLGANSFPLRAAQTSLEMRSRVNCPGFITVCSSIVSFYFQSQNRVIVMVTTQRKLGPRQQQHALWLGGRD